MVGIGSPRASLESNFVLRALVGADRFYQGVSAAQAQLIAACVECLQRGPVRAPSLREVECSDAVLVLGEDLHPRAHPDHAHLPPWDDGVLHEATQGATSLLWIASPQACGLDADAALSLRAAPETIARLGWAVAHALDPRAPEPEPDALPAALRERAVAIAAQLRQASRPVIISGISCGSEAVVRAAAQVAWATAALGGERSPGLALVLDECNAMGLALCGGPGFDAALAKLGDPPIDTLLVLENDLYQRAPAPLVDRLLAAAKHVVVLDHIAHRTGARAELLLPAAPYSEAQGTLVSFEGRAQRSYPVLASSAPVRESWRWLRDAMQRAGLRQAAGWQRLDDVIAELARALPVFAGVAGAAPPHDSRIAGAKIPRQPRRYSGRTALYADRTLHEPPPPADPDAPLSYSMEGYPGQPPPPLITHYWAPGWNSVQSLNRFQQEIGGPLRGGDPGVRLLEPAANTAACYVAPLPVERANIPGSFRLLGLPHIFGSEAQSALVEGIAARGPRAQLALNCEDARALGAAAGEALVLEVDDQRWELPLHVRDDLPRGVAGVPAGLPGVPVTDVARWARIVRR